MSTYSGLRSCPSTLMQRQTDYQRSLFRKKRQLPNEVIDTGNTMTQHISMICGITDLDAELKSHMTQTCCSATLRRKSLHKTNMTLTELLEHSGITDMTDQQAKSIESVQLACKMSQFGCKRKEVKGKDWLSQQQQYGTCVHCGGT